MLNEQKLARALMALDNMNVTAGNWTDEAKIRHLTEQMQQAKTHLMQCLQSEDGVTPGETQIYATIRTGTRYENQNTDSAFPVRFKPDIEGYHWQGGPGGRYRHSDLVLYIKNKDGEAQRIPTFNAHEDLQVLEMVLIPYERRALKGDQDPEWITKWTTELIQRLETLEKTTHENYVEYEE